MARDRAILNLLTLGVALDGNAFAPLSHPIPEGSPAGKDGDLD